jgi:hypothetical protein
MNLTRRGKWLIGSAALIAAWVAFGPKEQDAVEPARASTTAAHAVRPAATATAVPMARSLLQVAHRVADATASGSLFAAHSWYVPPPPPPPAPVVTAPVVPPKPVAPPLPFSYMGSYTPNGSPAVFFLTNGEKVYDVHLGDTIDNTYTIDSFNNGQLVFTYKPLNQQQQLSTGGAP